MSKQKRYPERDPRYEWALHVKKGDVLVAPSGLLRIVRGVHDHRGRHHDHYQRSPYRQLTYFFAIQRCSWTHAGYTLYSAGELIQMGWRPTGLKQKLGSDLDKQLERDFDVNHGRERCLRCCDVVGLP